VSLATAKNHDPNAPKDASRDSIVIWYWNHGKKIVHGAEFQVLLLDTAGNRYPASQLYQTKGDLEPRKGDIVRFDAESEVRRLGDKWEWIDGLEIRVTRVLFRDATVWTPRKGEDCKAAFLNEDFERAASEASTKAWNRAHRDEKSEAPR